ncbi:hypothetical protein SUGI_1049290 [Cryptomeria japonica]|nr:hypothetical protein SUGI_1049290 [Cryptomeria japonica]
MMILTNLKRSDRRLALQLRETVNVLGVCWLSAYRQSSQEHTSLQKLAIPKKNHAPIWKRNMFLLKEV